MRNRMARPHRLLRVALCLLPVAVAWPAGAETENPCPGKPALTRPVLALVPPAATAGQPGHEGSGIGGTGHVPPAPQLPDAALARLQGGGGEGDGIGGTGIVGVINGFGSLCVAGHEIHYDVATPVRMNHAAVAAAPAFGLGQMVSIRALPLAATDSAAGTSGGSYVATEIRILHEVHGTIESVSADGKSFRILGQQVRLGDIALGADMQGVRVAVSGYRLPEGAIQASRVERDASPLSGMIGTVEAVQGQTLTLSGQAVKMAVSGDLPAVGHEISVEGVMRHGVFVAESWQVNPRLAFAAPVERLLLQGHVRAVSGETVNLDGIKVHFPDDPARLKAGDPLETRLRVDPASRMDSERWTVESSGSRNAPARPETSGRPDVPGRPDAGEMLPRQDLPVNRPDIPQRYPRIELIRPERMGTFGIDHPARLPDRPGVHR